ncbi:MAG: thymidine phosphorylase family protein [Parvibaculum sp.]|uniref:thymidine phosphorylase family protein n=1 Tax=Parvibaculum sp. TaxID=2024848 RepID=UPI0025CDDC0D|nr:thymidine phosphorylase family protein [Parvibaculum sp.]MCE9650080.1 thymidine phosphorylase family protein [Parvibaculum sp.]
MKLRIRRVPLDTLRENVAVLSASCTALRPESFQAFKRLEIVHDDRVLIASLDVTHDLSLVAPDQIGLTDPAFCRLGLPEGAEVSISPARRPQSLSAVGQKISGGALSGLQIGEIVRDIAAHRYSDMEIVAFLVGCAGFMTSQEVLDLTRAMANAGTTLHWPSPMIVDKHCIGGIPGNRTSMIVVPIVAAHGLSIPKTSSRAITSPAGTADTMEVLANVDLSVAEMRKVVEACKGCLVWGGHVNLSPVDDILIGVERPLNLDTREQMVASIMSKKLAAGSTHLLIDVPIGPTAKIRNGSEALKLRKLFEYVSDQIGLKVEVVVTDGSRPVGRGVGPVLEARDVMAVLRNDVAAPSDLREKSLRLAGLLIDQDPAVRGGAGYHRAEALLASGAALAAMERIIEAQGRPRATPALGALQADILAPSDGVVLSTDCLRISQLARLAGAPIARGAGLDLFRQVGDRVEKGEPLFRIYAAEPSHYDLALAAAREENGFALGVTNGENV